MSKRLRVFVANRIQDHLVTLMTDLEPRIDVVWTPELLRPRRRMGDHHGDPAFVRTAAEQERFQSAVDSADALFGVPDESADALHRTANVNRSLRWVHTMAAGGGVQVKQAGLSAQQLDAISFTTSAGVHAGPLAEFALLGVLAGIKDLVRLQDAQGRREWQARWPMTELRGRTIVVIGLGQIGSSVALKTSSLGMRVIGVQRSTAAVAGVSQTVPPHDLASVLPLADAVVVALPGTDATRRMIGADAFATMRPGTTFVNVGRGTVVDEAALVAALESGRVGFAALDVFETEPLAKTSRLWAMHNVIVSPHTAALNADEDRRIVELFADNASRLLDGEALINRVNTVEFY